MPSSVDGRHYTQKYKSVRLIGELLSHAKSLTQVLADRREQLGAILGDGSKLLDELNARRQVIAEMLTNTSSLAQQLQGLVTDNQKTLKPACLIIHTSSW